MDLRHISAKGTHRVLRDVEEGLRSVVRSQRVSDILAEEQELWGASEEVASLEKAIVRANRHTHGKPDNHKHPRRRRARGPRYPWQL